MKFTPEKDAEPRDFSLLVSVKSRDNITLTLTHLGVASVQRARDRQDIYVR